MKFFRISFILTAFAMMITATGCTGSSQSSDAANDSIGQSLFNGELDDEDRLPLEDTEYINTYSGDMWKFAIGVSGDGSDPINIALFRGNGMQGYDMYEMRPIANSRFSLHQDGKDEPCGIEIFVYPGRDSIDVYQDGFATIFQTAESCNEAVSANDPSYTPYRYAIKAGENGGKWEQLESGEITYTFPDDKTLRSQWVIDGEKIYYVDPSGCRMKNNYAYDGFYVGNDGAWDRSVKCLNTQEQPRSGGIYTDGASVNWTFNMTTQPDGTIEGTARRKYGPPMNFTSNYHVTSYGNSVFGLFNVDDEYDCWQMSVLNEGHTIRLSGAGVTEEFQLR
ncbi:MAG: hypothetical protein J6X81_01295 [Muribaculaceae bacterium]|nr:hypothetical protein [Muribaculaceae bacterium]